MDTYLGKNFEIDFWAMPCLFRVFFLLSLKIFVRLTIIEIRNLNFTNTFKKILFLDLVTEMKIEKTH